MAIDFLGQGFHFPLQTNTHGGIKHAGQDEKIRQSIMVILGTQRGERLMRPNFGSNLKRLLFAPNNTGTADLAGYYVAESLNTWEPRITVDEIRVENDNKNSRLLIHLHYRIKATNEPGNLVYPFYLQQPQV